MERSALLQARGLRVLRFTNDEVEDDLPAVLAGIAATVSGEVAVDVQPQLDPSGPAL